MAILKYFKRADVTNIGSLGGVISYCVQDKKTKYEDANLVSGINCTPKTAMKDFIETKKLFGKEDGMQYYYAVQSFGDEMTDPYFAHQMALELAERCYPNHQVLVATHTDTDNIHSHIIINSVNSITGAKIHQGKKELYEYRKINDEICLKYGADICKPKHQNVEPMSNGEYFSAINQGSWKIQLCVQISLAMQKASSKDEFISIMNDNGYKVDWADNHKYITYTTPTGKKCRDNKLHDEKYLKEVLEHEFKFRQEIVAGRIDINGVEIQQSVQGQARASSTSAAISNADREKLDESNSNSRQADRNAKDIQRTVTDDSNEARAGRIPTDIPQDVSYYIQRNDRTSQMGKRTDQQKDINSEQGNQRQLTGYRDESQQRNVNDKVYSGLWQIGHWDNERRSALGYSVTEGQAEYDDTKAYYNPLNAESYPNDTDDSRYISTSEIITDTGVIIGGMDSVIDDESDDPEKRERERRTRQNMEAVAQGMNLLAEIIEEQKAHSDNDFDDDDDQSYGFTMSM